MDTQEETKQQSDMMLTATPPSKDEVDFVKSPLYNSNNINNNNNNNINSNHNNSNNSPNYPKVKSELQVPKISPTKVPKEQQRLSTLFSFSKKSKSHEEKLEKKEKSNAATTITTHTGFPCQPTPVPIGTPPRQKKFVKSTSIARLLGNTYNAKKFEKEEKKLAMDTKFNTFGGRRRTSGPYLERFKRYAKEEGDVVATNTNNSASATNNSNSNNNTITVIAKKEDKSGADTLDRHLLALEHFQDSHHGDFGSKAMRTISRGLGKLWWKRTHSIDISSPDPEFKVSYLGNVLTGWAKGEGCVEKQLNTLWRNYTQNNKPDVIMRLKVCASGLKATTRQHGLTEYWANRITHCCAPKNYPRVFCWIYRHEGRKLKHELRCHAVLCSKEKQVQEICDTLKANLECALREFKREKILKQNARLSLANAVYDNPSLPRRKILLSVGSNNYRPPLERSKSAPKLMAIEEAIGEEGEEAEETNEPEMKPCCQKDSLYPAMTLGRRRCRRGHSIRRTGKARPVSFALNEEQHRTPHECCSSKSHHTNETKVLRNDTEVQLSNVNDAVKARVDEDDCRINYGSDDSDDFDKILKHNNYDSEVSLANELMPYFESQLHKKISSSCGSLSDLRVDDDRAEPLSLLSTINIDPNADPKNDFNPEHDEHNDKNLDREEEEEELNMVSLRRSGVCSDGEDDFLGEEEDDMYFRQAAILNMLHRHSMRKMANLSLSSDEGSSSLETNTGATGDQQQQQQQQLLQLQQQQMRYKHQAQSSISSDTSSVSSAANQQVGCSSGGGGSNKRSLGNDSADDGSISSGCETASTVTNNQDDLSLQFRQSHLKQISLHLHAADDLEESSLESSPLTAEELYKHLHSRSNSDTATTFSSSSSITLKMDSSPCNSVKDLVTATTGNHAESMLSKSSSLHSNGVGVVGGGGGGGATNIMRPRRMRRQRDVKDDDSDSDCSDESGYVEYQERDKKNICNSSSLSTSSNKMKLEQSPKPQLPIKPQVPPKPMPRRFINNTTSV